MLDATGFTLDYMLKQIYVTLKNIKKYCKNFLPFYAEVICFFNECKCAQSCDNMSSDDFKSQPIWCYTMFKRKGNA